MFSMVSKMNNTSNLSSVGQQTPEKRKKNATPNALNTLHIQTKLTVGRPNDVYEQEADRVANQVVSMPETSILQRQCTDCENDTLQLKPAYPQITPIIQCQPLEEEEELLQPKTSLAETNDR